MSENGGGVFLERPHVALGRRILLSALLWFVAKLRSFIKYDLIELVE